jgi:cytochrome c oxidase subunit III
MSTEPTLEIFPLAHKDHQGARIGMWLFLFTELLLFGGLFLLYAVYRHQFPADFHFAAGQLDTFMGGLNTVILLTSSLTMVLAVLHLEHRKRKYAAWMLSATMIMGVIFLINKYLEWSTKIHHGLYPNSEVLQSHTPGESVFYSLYYLMTGLHGLHIMIGLVILSVMLFQVVRRPRRWLRLGNVNRADLQIQTGSGDTLWRHGENEAVDELEVTLVYKDNEDVSDRLGIKIENAGLYWHLVDVIWIFLFPLFYLIT